MISIKSTSYYVKTNFDKIVQTSLYTSVKLGWLEELIVREHFILQKKKKGTKGRSPFCCSGNSSLLFANFHQFRCTGGGV